MYSQVLCDKVEDVTYENNVDDLLRKLKAAVDKAVIQAQKALDDARAQLAAFATKYEGDADTAMATTEKTFLDQLEALETLAKNKNISIDECLGENETKLKNLPATYHTSMLTCVNGVIADGTKYAQEALDKVITLESRNKLIRFFGNICYCIILIFFFVSF